MAMSKDLRATLEDELRLAVSALHKKIESIGLATTTFVGTLFITVVALFTEATNVNFAVNTLLPDQSGPSLTGLRVGLKITLISVIVIVHYALIRAHERFGAWVDTILIALALVASGALTYFMMGLNASAFQGEIAQLADNLARAQSFTQRIEAVGRVLIVLWPLSLAVAHLALTRLTEAWKTIQKSRADRDEYVELKAKVDNYFGARAYSDVQRAALEKVERELPGTAASVCSVQVSHAAAYLNGIASSAPDAEIDPAFQGLEPSKIAEQAAYYERFKPAHVLQLINDWRAQR